MMKTIQQHFIEADVDSLISKYIYTYPIEIKSLDDVKLDKTLKELYESYCNNLKSLVSHIQTCEMQETGDPLIFFAYHVIGDDDIDFALVSKSELLDDSNMVSVYSYEFSPIEETSGFLVADTYLTQLNLDNLLISYLFESSFFGYNQEYLEEERSKLFSKIEYLEDHLDELLLDAKEQDPIDFGIEFEKRDKEELQAWESYISYEYEYSKKAFEIEKGKVVELLKGQQ